MIISTTSALKMSNDHSSVHTPTSHPPRPQGTSDGMTIPQNSQRRAREASPPPSKHRKWWSCLFPAKEKKTVKRRPPPPPEITENAAWYALTDGQRDAIEYLCTLVNRGILHLPLCLPFCYTLSLLPKAQVSDCPAQHQRGDRKLSGSPSPRLHLRNSTLPFHSSRFPLRGDLSIQGSL
jgi:hypothetical protein